MSGVVVLISGRGSNMQAVVEAGVPVAAVISNRADAGGLEFARSRGIETRVLESRARDRQAYDQDLLACVQGFEPDLVVLAGFLYILGREFVAPFAGRIINIHPSLLPAFVGLDTHRRALEAGVWFHGCTVHYVTPELDAGPIIWQTVVNVLPEDTPETLGARVLAEEHKILPRVVQLHLAGRFSIDQGRVSIVPDRVGRAA